jgi:phosphoesterase RecJ-like protein
VGLALRARGAQVVVSFGDEPFAVPRSLAWLPGVDDLVRPPAAVPASPQVAAAFDTSSPDRLGVLRPLVSGAGSFVVVDHHGAGEEFGDVAVIDVTAPATALLVLDLLDRMGAPLTPDIATCLYAGLLTDTGGFRFAATTAATTGRRACTGGRPATRSPATSTTTSRSRRCACSVPRSTRR